MQVSYISQSGDHLPSWHAHWVGGGCLSVESRDSSVLTAVQAQMVPLWKKFLLNQFHDVLPGSCIEQVCVSWKWSDYACKYMHGCTSGLS